MSNSVTKIKIQRSCDNGVWNMLSIRFKKLNGRYSVIEKPNLTNGDENSAVSYLLNSFLHFYSKHSGIANLDELKSDIVEGFCQLRENDIDGDSEEHMEEHMRTLLLKL